ncbi:unnamed protein product, partial [Effrenium voratum]
VGSWRSAAPGRLDAVLAGLRLWLGRGGGVNDEPQQELPRHQALPGSQDSHGPA